MCRACWNRPVWRLPLADGRRVFLEFHSYLGPNRVCRREIATWYEDPLLVAAVDWFASRHYPALHVSWAEQSHVMQLLPPHLERMVPFGLNTGARDENVCGLRWAWERQVPEVGRSVFVVPARSSRASATTCWC